jgi:hypothetical protein
MKGSASRPSNDERDTLGHQAGHKGDVARQAVQLGNNYAAFRSLRGGQRCGELRASVQGIAALAGFGFNILSGNHDGFGGRKSLDDGGALGIDAEAGAVLFLRRDPEICNRPLHDQTAYHRMAFGRSAKSSNIIAVFMLHQHRRSLLAAGRPRLGKGRFGRAFQTRAWEDRFLRSAAFNGRADEWHCYFRRQNWNDPR